MTPITKKIMNRYSFIILVMVLVGLAIIVKAGVIMFAERQYWQDVADRFVKENVTVRPNRGNIISSDGRSTRSIWTSKLVASIKTRCSSNIWTLSATGFTRYSQTRAKPSLRLTS